MKVIARDLTPCWRKTLLLFLVSTNQFAMKSKPSCHSLILASKFAKMNPTYNLSSMSLVCFSKNSSLTVPRTVVRMFEHSFHLVRNNKAERPQRPLIKQNELHKKNSPNRGSPQVRLEVVAFLANEVDGVGLKRRVTIELVKQNENYLTPCLPPRNRNTSLFRELKPVFSEEE